MGKSKRVGIVGVGHVGSTVGYSIAMRGLAHEVILSDHKVERAKGMALDMSQSAQAARMSTLVKAAQTPEDLVDCDLVVVTAGSPRLPGMSRDDLLLKNAQIMKEVSQDIKTYSPNAIIVPVSNPLDVMVYVALRVTGWDRSRIVGMSGILDSARMAHYIQEAIYAKHKIEFGGQIRAQVIGGHGDTMVPLPRFTTVAGLPLTDFLDWSEINEIVEKTKNGGAEIVRYLQTGSAYYAPAKATSLMVESILHDKKLVYPCAVRLEGEYSYDDVVNGLPVMLGAGGIEQVFSPSLDAEQDRLFARSVRSVRDLIDVLNKHNFFDDM
jgi:malate dehydrogenase